MQYSTRSAARYVPATTFYEHSARNEGAYNLLQLNSFVGMTADATHMGTTARQSGSNASHGNSAAGAAAAPSSSSNPGQCLEASNRRNNCRPREVGRGCPGDDGAESARAALPPCVASGLSGSGPYVFRCGHSRVTIELKQIMCAFIARRICRTP